MIRLTRVSCISLTYTITLISAALIFAFGVVSSGAGLAAVSSPLIANICQAFKLAAAVPVHESDHAVGNFNVQVTKPIRVPSGAQVFISSTPDGTGSTGTDDRMTIKVAPLSGGIVKFRTWDYRVSGAIQDQPPTLVTDLFPANTPMAVTVIETDLEPPLFWAKMLYLVIVPAGASDCQPSSIVPAPASPAAEPTITPSPSDAPTIDVPIQHPTPSESTLASQRSQTPVPTPTPGEITDNTSGHSVPSWSELLALILSLTLISTGAVFFQRSRRGFPVTIRQIEPHDETTLDPYTQRAGLIPRADGGFELPHLGLSFSPGRTGSVRFRSLDSDDWQLNGAPVIGIGGELVMGANDVLRSPSRDMEFRLPSER